MKPYFCLWFDEDGMHEKFFDNWLDAFHCAWSCDISEFRYHWGDTQTGEDTQP